MSAFELMAAPFAECLVLVAIHTYLGIHVLKRRVIFVDLALAQIAALGTTVGFLFGIMPETTGALVFSMAFTFLGAAVFSITRFRSEQVPQEAIIGLTYAISCALAVLVVEKTNGAEHLKDILVGNLLWVKWSDVALAAAVYLVVGAVHFAFRRQFLLISDDPDAAYRSGMPVRAWDFLFYLTFGVVIALSTRVAGVLLVFVFLVAPAILAFTLTSSLRLQLVIGWVAGTVVTVAGLYLSWKLDLPSGPAVIAFYGIALALAGVVVFLWRAENRSRAARAVLLGLGATAVVVLGLWSGGRWLGESSISVSDEVRMVEEELARDLDETAGRQRRESDERRRSIASRVAPCVGENKVARYLSLVGPEERLALAGAKVAEHPTRALEFLLIALSDEELPLLYREEAAGLLGTAAGETFGYDPQAGVAANAAAIRRICDRLRAIKRTATGEDDGPDGGR
jgi:zinc/manganese transport system permease protein